MVIVGGLLNLVLYSTALASTGKDAELEAKVKAGVIKLGTGIQSIVKVKLRDKTVVKGHISEITEDSFSVVNEKTQSVTKIPYSSVKQISGKNNLSGKTILAYVIIGVIIVAIAIRGI